MATLSHSKYAPFANLCDPVIFQCDLAIDHDQSKASVSAVLTFAKLGGAEDSDICPFSFLQHSSVMDAESSGNLSCHAPNGLLKSQKLLFKHIFLKEMDSGVE